ncbi:uncharacterized protein LOC135834757 isoform X2 [Planococcus citri]|uniref:uncharacterized protein LOC135834757 isoform X2 n=1 Tax=Planococcus citri TaxID=170843 RepID=UPI0031F982C9
MVNFHLNLMISKHSQLQIKVRKTKHYFQLNTKNKYKYMIPDALDRGELKGKLDMLAHQAVMAEETLKEQGDSRDKAATYQLLLGLTFRVDTLESILVPDQKLVGQRSKRWMHILSLNTPAVVNLRKKVIAAGMTEHSFAKEIERLIQERNNRVGHANVPLPRLIKKKTIEGALRIMEITEDDAAVETLKILVAPVKGLDFEPSAATDPTDPATTDPTCQLINATDPTICERKGN